MPIRNRVGRFERLMNEGVAGEKGLKDGVVLELEEKPKISVLLPAHNEAGIISSARVRFLKYKRI